jgi:hypothetical protein
MLTNEKRAAFSCQLENQTYSAVQVEEATPFSGSRSRKRVGMEERMTDVEDFPLFEGEGELSPEDEAVLKQLEGEPLRDIHTIRQKNRVSIGVPISLPLTPLLQGCGQDLPADIQLQLQDFEFYQIQFACSFEAGFQYRFHEARFQVTLETRPVVSGRPDLRGAIAYDLFPLHLEDQRQVSIKRSLNPQIRFRFDPLSGSLAVPLYEHGEEYLRYTARISAFDLQGTQPAWSLARTHSHEIEGSQKLFMIVRKPKGTQVYASFKITASVEYLLGNIVLDPFPLSFLFRRRQSTSTRAEAPAYPLC